MGFSVTGDYRIIYRIEKGLIQLLDLGTHSQIYRNLGQDRWFF